MSEVALDSVVVEARVPGLEPDQVYDAVADFERYAEMTEAVRQVEIKGEGEGGGLVSSWEVNFRNGVLRWSEEDWFDREGKTIRFAQVDGDMEHYAGAWEIESTDDGPVARFQAEFDLGIPSLRDMLHPIAKRALYNNMVLIMTGLLGSDLHFVTDPPD